MSTFKDQLW